MSKLHISVAEIATLPSATAAAPVLERTTQHYIDALAAASGPPHYTLTPQAARAAAAQVAAALRQALHDQ
jgi:acetyl esterase